MKKIILNTAIILSLALTIFSCEDDDTVTKLDLQADIIGQWMFSEIDVSAQGSSSSDTETEDDTDEGFDGYLGDVLEFQADGTFASTYTYFDIEPEEGTWSVNDQTLVLNYDNLNNDLLFTIETPVEDELIITLTEELESSKVVYIMGFIRL